MTASTSGSVQNRPSPNKERPLPIASLVAESGSSRIIEANTPGTSQTASATGGGTNIWTELGPEPIINPNNTPIYGTAPFSGRVTAIAINGSNAANIYVGAAQGGVWKSLDGGSTWTALTDNQPSLAMGAIMITPDSKTIYAGTGEPNHAGDSYYGAGLLRSSDGGRTWTTLGSGAFSGSAISGVVFIQGTPNKLIVGNTYAACCNGAYAAANSGLGIYLSTDGGSTWTRTLSPSSGTGIAQIIADPSSQSTVYASDFGGSVWRSTDGGSTWSLLLTSSDSRSGISVSPALSGNLFAAFSTNGGELDQVVRYDIANNKVYYLTNPPAPTGLSSVCNRQCNYDLVLSVDSSNSNIIYFGAVDLYKSSDGGQTWSDLGGYSGTLHPDQHALTIISGSPSTFYVGNDGGIWKSTDRGTTWSNLNAGLGITQFYSITGSPNGLLFGGTQDNGCDQYHGTSAWSLIVSGDGGWSGYEASNPNIMYCNYVKLKFQKSTDGGATFNLATSGLTLTDYTKFIAPVAQDPSNGGTLYIGSVRVYRTTDFATTWTDVSGVLGSNFITALAVAPTNSNTLYLGDGGGNVKVSQDAGRSWQTILQKQYIESLAVDPTNANVVYVAVALQGVWKVSYAGNSWQGTQLTPPPQSVNVIRMSSDGKNLYVGTDIGVYYSNDGGTSWASVGTGLPNVAVFDLAIASSNLLVAATHGRGVWDVSLSQIISLTVNYSVQGGGSGYSAPVLTYTSGGLQKTATITATATTYALDQGSAWGITNPLSGSGSSERWDTNQPTSGIGSSAQTVSLVYYHQYSVSIGYTISGGGSPTAPTLSSTQFGASYSPALTGTPAGYWLDNGAAWTITNPLPGSASSERWQTNSLTAGMVSSSVTLSPTYYHQFLISVSYSTTGGGTPATPSFTYVSFGENGSVTLASSAQSVWADTSAAYYVTNPLGGSTSTERWLSVTASGTIRGQGAITFVFSHQYHVSVSGGTVLQNWFDSGSMAMITTNGVSGRASGTGFRVISYSIDNGATTSVAPTSDVIGISILMNSPHSIIFNTVRQYEVTLDSGAQSALVSITPPTISGDNYWYDSGASVSYMGNGVFGRASGSGERSTGWAIDSQATPTQIATTGTFSIAPINVTAAHTIHVTTLKQYQVSLDSGASQALDTISSSTLSQDYHWYDAGSQVSMVLNGVWGRASGTGNRLVSYAINGAVANSVATTGKVTVLSVSITSPQLISTSVTAQFLLDAKSGSLVSVTAPTISGDTGWYDSTTNITAVYNYVWNATGYSRTDAVAYELDRGDIMNLPRAGNGTFSVGATMDKAHAINIIPVSQYEFTVSGGNDVAISVPSPTGDSFYDKGTSASVGSAYTWDVVGGSRQNLLSYTLDGKTFNITRGDAGRYTTPAFLFDHPHVLTFNQVTQYLITFTLTDNSGSLPITTARVSLDVGGVVGVEEVNNSTVWLDKGSSFTLASIVWENVDVKPLNAPAYAVTAPLNATVHTRTYDATLKVMDPLGQAVSGATVNVVFAANGDQIERTTGADGLVTIPLIPLGKYDATVSNLGLSTQVHGDASVQAISQVNVTLSYPVLGITGVAAAVVILIPLAVLWRRRGREPKGGRI